MERETKRTTALVVSLFLLSAYPASGFLASPGLDLGNFRNAKSMQAVRTSVMLPLKRSHLQLFLSGGLAVKSLSACRALSRTRSFSSQSTEMAVGPSSGAEKRNSDPSSVAVIVGASRGIGLAMASALPDRFQGRIITAVRNPQGAQELLQLKEKFSDRLEVVPMDITVEESVAEAAKMIEAKTNGRVDLLINTVGVLHDKTFNEQGRMPERQIAEITEDWFLHNIKVNTLGPVWLLKHFQKMLRTKQDRPHSVFATISARVGSIEDNYMGGWYSYRVSKAAQNQFTKTASIELKRQGCAAIALHPGTVATELSKPFQARVKPEKLFTVDKAAKDLLDVIDSVSMAETGSFFAYDREKLPW